MSPKTYLLSRGLDPILGIFTGVLAYHLRESNPRTAPSEGHTLRELVTWTWDQRKREREQRDLADEGSEGVEWERLRREIEK